MSALAARVTLFAKYRSFSCKFFTAVRRSLFSHEILGIENFKRLRIFGNDRLGDTRDQFIQNLVTARDNEAKRKGLVRDVVQLVYIAETKCEVSLIADLLKQLHCNQTEDTTSVEGGEVANDELHSSGPGRIHFGPLLMRLLYILGQTDTALNLWENEELEPLFQNVTCYLLLMDMLYEGKQYDRVVSTFTRLQDSNLSAIKYPPDCTTLALAALYQLNTPESYEQMRAILEGARVEGNKVSRRSLLFAAALAIRQAQHDYALNLCENAPKKNETLFRNMKTMALAGLGRIDEAISLMEDGLWTDVPTLSRTGILFADTVHYVEEQVKPADKQLMERLKHVQKMLEAEGMLSPKTVEHYVTRTILLQRKPYSSRRSFKTKVKSPVKQLQHLHSTN